MVNEELKKVGIGGLRARLKVEALAKERLLQ